MAEPTYRDPWAERVDSLRRLSPFIVIALILCLVLWLSHSTWSDIATAIRYELGGIRAHNALIAEEVGRIADSIEEDSQ